ITATRAGANAAAGSLTDTIARAGTGRRSCRCGLGISVVKLPSVWREQNRIRVEGRRHRQRRILDDRRMRIRRYHLRDAQVSLRKFSERRRGLLFTAAAAAAAGFLLFRLAAT